MYKLFVVLLLTGNFALGDCADSLSKCDTALNAVIKVNDLQKQIIADQEARFKVCDSNRKDLEVAVDAWYRNPFIVLTIGVLGGIIISQKAMK